MIRNHQYGDEGFHVFARHSPITHRLEAGESFGDVYRRSRHRHPNMTARYSQLVGVESPDFSEPDPADIV